MTATVASHETDSSTPGPLLDVRDLSVTFARRGQTPVHAVDEVSFSVGAGQHVGLVGESGSGKSVTSLAIMGLLPDRGVQVGGTVAYAGADLLSMPTRRRNALRGRDIAMVFQDPMTSLNPVVRIGTQIEEVVLRHTGASKPEARERAVHLLQRVGIPDAGRRVGEYPHQLSGGMRQRALIAIALACRPRLLICDEPTTALDATIQAQVLELLRELVAEMGTAMMMITHDLGVVAGLCDRVNVMYAGRVVEAAGRRELFAAPRHRYTEGLLASIPRLDSPRGDRLTPIPGTPRDTIGWDKACAFAPRCRHVTDACVHPDLELAELAPDHHVRCVHPAAAPSRHPETAPSQRPEPLAGHPTEEQR